MAGDFGLGELALIERIRGSQRSRNGAVRVGIGDDCAVLRAPAGCEMVVTTDFCLEGRHFRREWHSAESAGHRCLVRGLSDVAAMGARPLAAFLSLALPQGFDVEWVDGFMAGLGALAAVYEVELAGGDTAQAPGGEILADVMVVGAVRTGKAMLRSGANVGDGIYVTGALGGSAAELSALRSGAVWPRVADAGHPHTFPEPRVKVGQELLRRKIATSCMDVSDGLSTDVRHLCEASGVGAEMDGEAIPVSPGATLEQAMHGGEDYELLFTAAPGVKVPKRIAGVAITRIGTAVEAGVRLYGREWLPGGWEHFKGRE